MRKIFLYSVLAFGVVSCKKATTSTNSPTTIKTEINFKSIGNPVGVFGQGVTDIEGTRYKTVIINKQEWMAENLKVSKYNDGTSIQFDTSNWSNKTTGLYSYYNNDKSMNDTYGKLYNWYVIDNKNNGGKNICPSGWHVPNDNEWNTLVEYLGGSIIAGGKLKEIDTLNWKSPNLNATNTSLFTALPGGYKNTNNTFEGLRISANFWYSDFPALPPFNTSPNSCLLLNNSVAFDKKPDYPFYGFSIRCIKD